MKGRAKSMNYFKRSVTAILTIAMLLITVCSCSNTNNGISPKTMSYNDARAELAVLAANVKPTTLPVRLDPNEMFDLDLSHEIQSLPDISEYPFVVNPVTANYITVYSTIPEIILAANDFNNAAITLSGQQVSVGVRAVGSALGTNFILSGKYTPDLLIPVSELYGGILSYRSTPTGLIAGTTVHGLSGVVVPDKTGVDNFPALVRRVHSGELSIGYVNPLQDPDGLNFILSVLYEFDQARPIGEAAVDGLRKLQNNITLIANDSTQLKSSFLRGILDGYVLNYNTYKSAPEYTSGYTFIPFGVPQNNPIYSVGELTPIKMQTAEKFAEYCINAEAGTVDSILRNYSSTITITSAIAGGLQSIYRSVRGGSSNITAIFVADISGSMGGTPLLKLKTGLRGAINAIDPNNNIGLVTFDDEVNIAVPIAPFDGKQQSYFSNAISNMSDGGKTAMYDALAVALQMLLVFQDENPDTKLVLFVLTDGDSNIGLEYRRMSPVIAGLKIPIYTIGYESETNSLNTDILEQLSAINEASFIDAGTDNITYILSSLLSSQA
jgi:Ca-activated chloride channel family protein